MKGAASVSGRFCKLYGMAKTNKTKTAFPIPAPPKKQKKTLLFGNNYRFIGSCIFKKTLFRDVLCSLHPSLSVASCIPVVQ